MAQLNTDLQIFNEYAYSAATEILRQQTELWNSATRGALVLRPAAHQGDFSELAFFEKLQGLVRRRDAYAPSGTSVTPIDMKQVLDTMVKVAAGTPAVNIPPGQYNWIQMNPRVAGAAMGQQLAKDMMADMLNTGLAAAVAAMGGTPSIVHDVTASGTPTNNPVNLNDTTRLFGDHAQNLLVWVMHSKPMFDYHGDGLANASRLYTYETVNVVQDAFGRIFVITDSPSLVNETPTPDEYHVLGLQSGALYVGQNNDYEDNWETKNGEENIQRSYQAEWTYTLGLRGYTWNQSAGGNPTDAALTLAANWPRNVTSDKDLAGVMMICQ